MTLADDPHADMSQSKKLLSFRELLSWKMPEHFCSTTNKQFNKVRVQAADGTPIVITIQINLYKLDFVTQRLKEQRVNFCGIVTHIKQYVSSLL